MNKERLLDAIRKRVDPDELIDILAIDTDGLVDVLYDMIIEREDRFGFLEIEEDGMYASVDMDEPKSFEIEEVN